jgi:TIR domain/PDZ domain
MIFVNYRRDDSKGMAGRLHDRLAEAFGRKKIFMDVDNIPPGVDFVNHLNNQVASCEVFLAVIGPNWLDSKNDDGARRLHDPGDFVAVEIAAALARDIRVIPVLVDGSRMPKDRDLPEVLKPLVRRHAIELRHDQFGRDAEALIERIRETLPTKRATTLWWKVSAAIAASAVLLLSLLVLPYSRLPSDEQNRMTKPAAAEVVEPPVQTEKASPPPTRAAAPPLDHPAHADQAEKLVENILDVSQWVDETQKALGLEFSSTLALITKDMRRKYQLKDGIDGLLITAVAPNSKAAESQLSAGDVIVAVSGEAVFNATDLRRLFDEAKKGGKKVVLLRVSDKNGGIRFAPLSIQ